MLSVNDLFDGGVTSCESEGDCIENEVGVKRFFDFFFFSFFYSDQMASVSDFWTKT